jgi:cell division inhibitor SulA/protein ImuA
VCELILAQTGSGELSVLLPVLRQLAGKVAWIAPPQLPYPPALAAAGVELSDVLLIETAGPAQAQWAAEQVLRSGACAAVLLWLASATARAVRRLQLAAEASGTFMALLLPAAGSPASSPAALRVQLASAPHGIAVSVRKRRGGWPPSPLIVEYPSGVVAGPVSAGVSPGGAADHQ